MHRTLRSILGTAAGALALTVAASTAAHAETQTAKDPRGDVETVDIEFRAAAKRAVDIVSSTNRYRGDTLRMSLDLVNLPETNYNMRWLVRAGGVVHLGYYTTTEEGSDFGFLPIGSVGRRGIQCEGLGLGVDRGNDRVTMQVPSSCFGTTETVRVAADVTRTIAGTAQGRRDDARRDGIDDTKGPKYGPALDRN